MSYRTLLTPIYTQKGSELEKKLQKLMDESEASYVEKREIAVALVIHVWREPNEKG